MEMIKNAMNKNTRGGGYTENYSLLLVWRKAASTHTAKMC